MSRVRYLRLLLNSDNIDENNLQQDDIDKIEWALEYAHEIRQFEIMLYWRRAFYFWGFILLFMTGYGLLARAIFENAMRGAGILPFLALSFIACIGFLVNFSWIFMERGAKLHQENWEKHIDYLEHDVTGQLHKILIGDRLEYFSLSKINQFVIRTFLMLWGFLSLAPILIYEKIIGCNTAVCQFLASHNPWLFPIGIIAFILTTNIVISFLGSILDRPYKNLLWTLGLVMGWNSSHHTIPIMPEFEDTKKKIAVYKRPFRSINQRPDFIHQNFAEMVRVCIVGFLLLIAILLAVFFNAPWVDWLLFPAVIAVLFLFYRLCKLANC